MNSENNNCVNVGLIGYGMSGQVFHAPIIGCIEGFQLKSIRSSSSEHISLGKSRYPAATFVSNNESIFRDSEIHLIVIASPNEFHFDQGRAALNAGKHLVIDKPFTIQSKDANELIALADSKQLVLSVFQNRRFDADFQTVKKVIDSGKLGRIVEVEIHFDRFRNWFKDNWREKDVPGNGILYDLGSHLIDQALCLFGMPDSISADLRIQRPGGISIDNFDIKLDYPDLKVALKSGMLVKQQGPRYTIHGINGSFIKYGLDVQEEDLKAGATPQTKFNWGEEPNAQWGKLVWMDGNIEKAEVVPSVPGDYRRYYQNIYEAITGSANLIVQPKQAADIIKIIEMAIISNKERKTVDL